MNHCISDIETTDNICRTSEEYFLKSQKTKLGQKKQKNKKPGAMAVLAFNYTILSLKKKSHQ